VFVTPDMAAAWSRAANHITRRRYTQPFQWRPWNGMCMQLCAGVFSFFPAMIHQGRGESIRGAVIYHAAAVWREAARRDT
jgi:hypothetical protein